MQVPARYATAQTLSFRMIVRGTTDYAGASDWTPVAGDVKISIDGAAPVNTTNLPTAVGKSWSLSVTTGETTGGMPMLDFGLFANRHFLLACLLGFFLMFDIIDQGTKVVEDQGLDLFTFGAAAAYCARDLFSANPAGIKKNTALANYMFRMSDSATGDPKTGLSVAVARALDGGAFGAATNTPATEIANGWYKISLSAGDMNGDTVAIKCTATGAKQYDELIVTEP